ncbi:kinase-like protein [Gonapodya prolifera JEL478]|uniref:Kinase-like protein n=1 Tax=Gonapodya prolifera (strain JEL478) TaxID=1344416 RepID=A0A139ADN8_GONPJ|nr:kinase-like protein [Gonapodya prolifera JEL478]|eukprot:KXS14887.1 kinase-like protein [Gonapodya prolifera JEL478]
MISPFVLPLYGVGSDVNGFPFFISPVMENGNVETYLRSVKNQSNFREEVLYDLARGMEYLHDVANVVHTDLKPGNALVNRDKRGVIADFGFAQLTGLMSKSMSLPGSWRFLPPERLGHALKITGAESLVTKAGDVYAFGIMMWFVSTCADTIIVHSA